MRRLFVVGWLVLGLCVGAAAGCGDATGGHGAYSGHGESADFRPASGGGKADQIAANFDRNFLMTDLFFTDADAVGVEGIQAFLNATPYDKASPLAEATFGGQTAAELIVEAAAETKINPILLLARMQVEQSLVSKPASAGDLRWALGCGCPDHSDCADRYAGFGRQMFCGAETLRGRFDDSVSGEGTWRAGHTEESLDELAITPANHATAALYAYTPWVLEGRGGNWLVWNITKKYAAHLQKLGVYRPSEAPWLGDECAVDSDCRFSQGGVDGRCLRYEAAPYSGELGFCVMECEGYCPDRPGEATSFCVGAPDREGGMCVVKADADNAHCGAIRGTAETRVARHVGESGAPRAESSVCVPNDYGE